MTTHRNVDYVWGIVSQRARKYCSFKPTLAICSIVLLLHEYLYRRLVADDVYISLAYAKNLGNGLGLVHNQGLRIEGYSNFLWVVILAPLQALGFDLLISAKVLGFMFSLLIVVMTAVVAKELFGPNRKLELLITLMLISLSPSFALWGISGMETGLFGFLLVLALVLTFVDLRHPNRVPFSAFAFLALSMTRPEGFILGITAWIWLAIHLLSDKPSISRAWLLRWTSLFLLMFVSYSIGKFLYFGDWFPNTVYVKSGTPLIRQVLRGLQYLNEFAKFSGYSLLLLSLGLSVLRSRFSSKKGLVLLILVVYIAFIVGSGGDWMPHLRFFAPLIPLSCVIFMLELMDVARSLFMVNRPLGQGLTATAVSLLVVLSLVETVDALYVNRSALAGLSDMEHLSSWVEFVREHSQPQDIIAVVDAGAIGYYTECYILDMWGLLDRHIAHSESKYPSGVAPTYNLGFGKWDMDYVMSKRPAFVQMHLDLCELRVGVLKSYWIGTESLLSHPDFRRLYEIQNLEHDPVFVRRDIVKERLAKSF